MEITLEKIELVKDRTGVSYKEAKEALEAAEGSVVDAIIAIEETVDIKKGGKTNEFVNETVDKIKELVKKGNISKIAVKKGDETIANIPVNVGVVGALVAPWGVVAAAVAAVGFKCKIELTTTEGKVIDITERAGDFAGDVKEKGSVVFDGVMEKSADAVSNFKEKAPDFVENIKEKAPDFMDNMKEKGGEAAGVAADAMEKVKEKTGFLKGLFGKKDAEGDDDESGIEVEFVYGEPCEGCEDADTCDKISCDKEEFADDAKGIDIKIEKIDDEE